jgi:G3E family GTPase
MNNGCICCTVRGDLIRIVEGLMKRKGKFDAIIVETTGLADPAPVAQTFFVDSDVGAAAKLDAVVTVADARWLLDRLKDAPEAKNQIAFADVILLNKIDLVTEDELQEVEARIRGINPYAKLHRTRNCAVPLDAVLGREAFDLERILTIEPAFLDEEEGHDHGHDHEHGHDHDHHGAHAGANGAAADGKGGKAHSRGGLKHYHDEEMQSVSAKFEGEMDPEKFMPWISELTQKQGPDILRSKGILAFKDEPKRFVFQGVHMILDGDLQRPWKDGEKRESKIVFIGRHLDEMAIRQGFLACAV